MLAATERWASAVLAAAEGSSAATHVTAVIALVRDGVIGLRQDEPRALRQATLREILDALDSVTLSLGGDSTAAPQRDELHRATQELLSALEPFADAPTQSR